jgi:hypothetical protein
VPLIDPEVRHSVGGQLRTTFRVRYTYQDIGGYKLHLRSYDGMTPGPTLRARPGDVLRIRLVNELPPNRDPQPDNHNLPNRLNTTNLHTHGLHVSPGGIADNALREMEPGQSYEIEVPIPPSHPPGHLLVSPSSSRVGECPGRERHGRGAHSRGRFRQRPADRQCAGARAHSSTARFRCAGHGGELRHGLADAGRAPLHRQRATAADDRDAAR